MHKNSYFVVISKGAGWFVLCQRGYVAGTERGGCVSCLFMLSD